MASGFSEEDFTCPVCCDIFNDPVLLHCSHSVCKVCLEKFWKTKESRECPVCRSISPVDCPLLNLALRNLCETFLQNRNQKSVTCDLHGEKLKLFCLDDQQLVCVVCQTSKIHSNHKFSPVDEAVSDRKNTFKPLQEKLKLLKDRELAWIQTAQHIKNQVLNTEKQIKEEFEKLHQFLHDEEAARISALRTEEEQKSQTMKKKIESLSRDIELLSGTIRAIEKEMSLDDVTFLQNYKMTVKRSQLTVQNPEEPSGALIHVAEHLSNLKFNVWEKMQNIVQYTPITLDPNTAHPFLLLSDDLTSVRYSDQIQELPDNPERFDKRGCILGSECFDSGTHCWDVEVGDSSWWIIGVMSELSERKGDILLRSGFWFMGYCNGKYGIRASPGKNSLLSVPGKLRRIQVKLDWERGTLSFINPLTNVNIHTIRHRFTDKVRPLFLVGCNLSSLQVLPLRK